MHAYQHDEQWDLVIPGLDATPSTWEIDLTQLGEVERVTAVQSIVQDMMVSFDLEHEPLLRLGLCVLGARQPTPLIVVGHSMAVDMQSWQFLLEDLQDERDGLD